MFFNSKTKTPVKKNILEKDPDNNSNPGFFDSIFGTYDESPNYGLEKPYSPWTKRETPAPLRKEFTIFSQLDHREKVIVPKQIEQVKNLIEEIKREVKLIKQSKQEFIDEVEEVEKVVLQSLPDKPGVYHIRFLEILLSFIRTLRAKVGEAKTWLAAMISKKKKRGSLFAVRTKQKGTQYSLSQELQSARSVQ